MRPGEAPPGRPLRPRTFEEHCERWRRGAGRLFTMPEIDDMQVNGVPEDHIFDFDSGLRLIITAEDHGHARYVHLSASLMSPIFEALVDVYQRCGFGLSFKRTESLALGCAAVITGIAVARWKFPMLSKRKGVPNWFAEIGS